MSTDVVQERPGLACMPSSLPLGKGFKRKTDRRAAPAYDAYIFDQPIDHFPHSTRYAPHTTGTFKQRYWFDKTYYKPGGPLFIVLASRFKVGEPVLSRCLPTDILMEATNGLGVILENRYYGDSQPFYDMSADHLAYLTTEQTIADNAYFAQHANFPGVDVKITAPTTNWILYGGSLAGAQTAWSLKTYPDILFGGIGSSATTRAILGYPEWYDPIQKLAPQDCVQSINGIIDKFDHLVATNNQNAIHQFKTFFGLEALTDHRDFAMTIGFPIGSPFLYPNNTWQELNWNPAASGSQDFFDFCKNITNLKVPQSITDIDTALSEYSNTKPWTNLGNYANYVRNVLVDSYCTSKGNNVESCYSTRNQSAWADITNSEKSAFLYGACTGAGLYQTAPKSGPSLISRVLQIVYTQEWCTWAFPPGEYNSIPSTPDLNYINSYGGLTVEADRLAHINGNNDVWLDNCYHSKFAPSPRVSTDLRPEYLISGGGHHWDSYGTKDIHSEPQFISQAHLWEIRVVKRWLKMGRQNSTVA